MLIKDNFPSIYRKNKFKFLTNNNHLTRNNCKDNSIDKKENYYHSPTKNNNLKSFEKSFLLNSSAIPTRKQSPYERETHQLAMQRIDDLLAKKCKTEESNGDDSLQENEKNHEKFFINTKQKIKFNHNYEIYKIKDTPEFNDIHIKNNEKIGK